MAVRALGQAVEQRETAPERLNQPRPAALSRGMGAALGNPLHRPPVGRPFGSSARSRITAGCLPSGGVDREGSLAIKEGEPDIAAAVDPERSQSVASSELEPA